MLQEDLWPWPLTAQQQPPAASGLARPYGRRSSVEIRVRPRFFDQVGHETMYASSGNKHFLTKSCHRQAYQNYEQPPQKSQNSYFQSHFSVLKIG